MCGLDASVDEMKDLIKAWSDPNLKPFVLVSVRINVILKWNRTGVCSVEKSLSPPSLLLSDSGLFVN